MQRQYGFSLIEVLISGALVMLAAAAGIMYVTRSAGHADWSRERVFARQKALSILSELKAYVEGGDGEVAADLDGFDDGTTYSPILTITPDPDDPGALVPADHPLSENIQDSGEWRWHRQVSVRPFAGVNTRDLRIATVKVWRHRPGQTMPGEEMADVSSVIRTIGDAFPTTQVYDVYLLALENTPGWWVYMDAIQSFVDATLSDLESRNPGLQFRTHWITKSGFGRDDEYAPYTNETRESTANTRWAYVYPGRMPAGSSAERYYVAPRIGARVNLDGDLAPIFRNELAAQESFTDTNGNGRRDPGEPYTDANGNGGWDPGNAAPYALADQYNHCMRWPDEQARFQARVAAGIEDDETPTWRLLLDRMIADPQRYHNAILINLHGELLPMPAARNYSDAAKIPELRPGWRAVAHPERLRPARVQGSDTLSDAPRFRVHAYKSEFQNTERLTTQEEPYIDANGDGAYALGETYLDWNGNGVRDAGIPIALAVLDGDFTANPNGAVNPSLVVRCLAGGIDSDGNGTVEEYADWRNASRYPESFTDANGDGIRQVAEPYFDVDGNGVKDAFEPHQDLDGDGVWSGVTETLQDGNGNGRHDRAGPADTFTDSNGNGRWDAAEPYWDRDGNGAWTPPTAPKTPFVAWNPAYYGNNGLTNNYIRDYGEPFLDRDGDKTWDAAEPFFDANQNGVADGGFVRGEMWYALRYDAAARRTVITLHGTPLETARTSSTRGLATTSRLYDLEYIPCPTPSTATGTNRFARDLYTTGDVPKNTARWTVELPLPEVRRAFATSVGANNGDAADRIVALETRWGADLTTGVLWPVRNEPQNLSRTFAYFYNDPTAVPFSERYQFIGDPRHSPYSDTDATGTTAAHGYNWFFDNFQTNGTATANWLAFDSARLRARWRGRNSLDVGRYMSWLRTALARTEAIYTTLTGFSYYYLSVGGDVGYDAANGFANSIPMSGTPFGISGTVNENTISGDGTAALSGTLKYLRSNNGGNAGIRSGGMWWSKPWIGELFQDGAYADQWKPWGNLRAATGATALTYRQIRRGSAPSAQQPAGTLLIDSLARLSEEGSTSVFNIGTSASTFHHQYYDGGTGSLVEDGPQIAANYNFPVPTTTAISRPFGLAANGAGGVGDEYAYTTEFPRFSAAMVRRFYNHQNGQTGSGLVRLREPGGARAAYIVVNGVDRTTESGSAFIARYSMLTLTHSVFAAGVPGGTNRVKQLPRVEIEAPTLVTEIRNPAAIPLRWSVEWKRWDGLPYTTSYPSNFAETESDLVYVPMYSRDNGDTWLHMRDNTPATPGEIPWVAGVGPDPAKTVSDAGAGDETFTWSTPSNQFPEGSYLIRVEAYRSSESLHYSQHMEKIYVYR